MAVYLKLIGLIYKGKNMSTDNFSREITKSSTAENDIYDVKCLETGQEFTITAPLGTPEEKIYDIINDKNEFGIVLEDFIGVTLKEFIEAEKLSIDNFLRIPVRISEIIGNLHKNDIIHGNINPQSIIIDDMISTVRISEFSTESIFINLNAGSHNRHIIRNIPLLYKLVGYV